MTRARNDFLDRLSNSVFHGAVRATLRLPYERRVPVAGAAMARVFGPLTGMDARIDKQLKRAMPDLDAAARKRIQYGVKDNMGRMLIESYSYEEFAQRCRGIPLSGPGWEALEAARRDGRPAMLFTGHFGNYAAIRMALEERGHTVGVLYRQFSNPYFERDHRAAMNQYGLSFPRGPGGLQAMLRNIRAGHVTAIVGDQHVSDGAHLRFFGMPAATSTAAARLALKYNAPLVPAYGLRQPDGLHFDVVIDPPIAPDTPERMSQALNDSLEAIVRAHPGQWLWTHRRWKLAQSDLPAEAAAEQGSG